MGWDSFVWFALAASLFWIAGAAVSAVSKRRLTAAVLTGCGSVIFIVFIAGVWISLGRPPLRTMGETRLWFSLFLSLIGLGVYLRWNYRWVLPFGCLMAVMFACINVFKPEIHSEELMPALRSPWFVPHVIVYMFAYAVMGIATILAVRLLWLSRSQAVTESALPVTEPALPVTEPVEVTSPATLHSPESDARRFPVAGPVEVTSPATPQPHRQTRRPPEDDLRLCDTLVRIGWGFLTMGIVMGALWAKQAWGDYWTWDPKETWAAATWLCYLLYLHLRQGQGYALFSVTESGEGNHLSRKSIRRALLLLVFSFILLQMCWWGVNYLPSSQGFSLHTY